MKPKTRIIIAIAGFVLLILFAWKFSNIVGYILAAGVLSLMGAPVMHFLGGLRIGKLKLSRTIRSLLVILLFFALIAGFLALFAPLLAKQASVLTKLDYEQIGKQLEGPIDKGLGKLKEYGLVDETEPEIGILTGTAQLPNGEPADSINVSILDADGKVVKTVQTGSDGHFSVEEQEKKVENQVVVFLRDKLKFSSVSQIFSNILGTVGNLFAAIFAVSFILFFFLREEGLFYNIILGLVPDPIEDKVIGVLEKVEHLLSRYFLALALQVILFTIMIWLGLNITAWIGANPVGAKYAFIIALVAGIMNLIPYLGPIIGGVFAILIALGSSYGIIDQGQIPTMLISIVIVFAVAQTIDNILIQPTIFSNSVNAHPLEIFIVILVAGALGGIIWMILAIPAYTIIRVVAKEFLGEFKVVKKLTQDI